MSIQHRNITDAERHEPKGASIAVSGQVLSSSGSGITSFVNPNTLNNITLSSSFEVSSLVSQSPTLVDTPLQINFGAGGSNSDVSISAIGAITILTLGVYFITIDLGMGRTNSTGISNLVTRLLINDVASGFVNVNKIDTSIDIIPVNISLLRKFSIGDTIKVQIMRDSSGANDGGLITFDPVLAGWNNAPSAAIRIQKITGAN